MQPVYLRPFDFNPTFSPVTQITRRCKLGHISFIHSFSASYQFLSTIPPFNVVSIPSFRRVQIFRDSSLVKSIVLPLIFEKLIGEGRWQIRNSCETKEETQKEREKVPRYRGSHKSGVDQSTLWKPCTYVWRIHGMTRKGRHLEGFLPPPTGVILYCFNKHSTSPVLLAK